jgi:hypothetical protein
MGHLRLSVVTFAMVALGCDGARSVLPTAPGELDPRATTPAAAPVVPTNAATIVIGEVVNSKVTMDDPLCDPRWPHRCRYYRLTAPADGFLEVTMRWSVEQPDPYPLDIDIISAFGRMGLPPDVGPGPQRRVAPRVKAGDTYTIEISSFLSPGEAFELTTALLGR